MDTKHTDNEKIARVSSIYKDSFIITRENKYVRAEPSGKLVFEAQSPLDYPCVGDWVYARYFDEDSFAVISKIVERKTLLKRKKPGKRSDFQIIASNIDTAFIMQSLKSDYNIRRLERYIAMVKEGGAEPALLLSKSDLISIQEKEERINKIRNIMPDIYIKAFSNFNSAEAKEIKSIMSKGKTYCLIGSSGVGKTSLLNNLLGQDMFNILPVRDKDGKGRHATTSRQMLFLDNNAIIIDTPGMRELGNIAAQESIDAAFIEISEIADRCRYRDCSHTAEPGCAVLAALNDGSISYERYDNYIKLGKESSYNEMSYIEKKRKDKKFGKMCKAVMQQKKTYL